MLELPELVACAAMKTGGVFARTITDIRTQLPLHVSFGTASRLCRLGPKIACVDWIGDEDEEHLVLGRAQRKCFVVASWVCSRHPICEFQKGKTANTKACLCGYDAKLATVCTGDTTGLFCRGDLGRCTRVTSLACVETDGSRPNEGPCMCSSSSVGGPATCETYETDQPGKRSWEDV